MADTTSKTIGTTLAVLPGGRSPRGAVQVVPIGRHGRPREEIRAIQRARILDAFVCEVGDKGLARAKVIAVCGRACVSAKEFYDVFAGKEECFFAAFDLGAELVWERGVAAYQQAAGLWEERVRAAIGATLEMLAESPAFCRLCIVEPNQAGPVGADRLDGLIRRYRQTFGGQRQVDVPPGMPVEARESALIGGALLPLYEYVMAGRAAELAQLTPLLTYSVALAVVGRERALRQLERSAG